MKSPLHSKNPSVKLFNLYTNNQLHPLCVTNRNLNNQMNNQKNNRNKQPHPLCAKRATNRYLINMNNQTNNKNNQPLPLCTNLHMNNLYINNQLLWLIR